MITIVCKQVKVKTEVTDSADFIAFRMYAKIMANVQERLKGASVEADFWHGENIDHDEKKAPNSKFH